MMNIVNLHNVEDVDAWLSKEENVYVGRFTKKFTTDFKWGNPFKLADHNNCRERVLQLYEENLHHNKQLTDSLGDLEGKVLGCWCAPLRCHAEVLHRLVGNLTQKMADATSIKDTTEKLDQQVTSTVQAMKDALEIIALERIALDINDAQLSIPPIDVATPPPKLDFQGSPIRRPLPGLLPGCPSPLSLSTIETNLAYETLLESNSSLGKDLSRSEISSASTSRSLQFSLDRCTNTERFEIESRLRTWRLKRSSSCLSPSDLSTSPVTDERKIYSAPSSPTRARHQREETRSRSNSTDLTASPQDSPRSYSHLSPTPSPPPSFKEFDNQMVTDDGTRKILEFLASKVDLLSVSINTIQFNLSKLSETFRITLDDKILGTDVKTEQIIDDKFMYFENKFDNIKSMFEKENRAMKKENVELRDKLDAYILKEADREEQLRDCFNAPHHPCAADLSPLRDDLERKLHELEVMLTSSEPLSRQRSFSEECRNDSPANEFVKVDEGTEESGSIHAKLDIIAKWMSEMDSRILKTDTRVLECEQYSRRECVVISGVPEHIKEDKLESTVIDILKNLKITINSKDISAIHRLGESRDPRYPSRVIVKFINRKITNLCFERKDRLPELRNTLRMNLRFYESLAQLNQESLRLCNWLKANRMIHDHFLRNGFSKIVVAEKDKPVKVPHPQFLRDKFEIPEGVN